MRLAGPSGSRARKLWPRAAAASLSDWNGGRTSGTSSTKGPRRYGAPRQSAGLVISSPPDVPRYVASASRITCLLAATEAASIASDSSPVTSGPSSPILNEMLRCSSKNPMSTAMTFAGARFKKSIRAAIATRGQGHRPKNGARSRIEVLLISTRTMSGLTSGGSATAARMRQSYVAISARSSQPPAPIASTTAAELTPSARPATNLRMQAGPRGAHRAELSVHEGPRRYHESPLYGRFAPRARPEITAPFWPPMHPAGLRCSSLTYARYARSSRLAGRAPRRPEMAHLFPDGPLVPESAPIPT